MELSSYIVAGQFDVAPSCTFSYQATLKRRIEIQCEQWKKKTTTRNHGDERWIWLFILCEKNVYCCWILTNSHVSADNCKLCNAVSKRLCDHFTLHNVTLLAICSSITTKGVKVRLLQSKPCLFSLNISLNSWQIQLYQLQTASTGRISWAKTLNIINLMKTLNSWCRGAIDKTTTLQVNFTGFNSRWRKFFRFFVLVVLFLFPLFVLFFFFFFNHTVKFAKISPGTYMFQRPFLRGLCMEGNLCFKTG